MAYRLEFSGDGAHWYPVTETHELVRDRLDDIQREAEHHSHIWPHVRIIHPRPTPPAVDDLGE